MRTFKELAQDLEEIRVVNMIQRRKMARKMRKLDENHQRSKQRKG